MNNAQHKELIEFLKQQSPSETLHEASFRILCFAYEDKKMKDWMFFKQEENAPAFKAKWIFPIINLEFHYLQKIQDVIDKLEYK